MRMPVIFTELYDVLRQVGATDEKARAAAVVHNDIKITQLQMSIDKRLARLEKELKRLKWGVVGVFWMAVAGAVSAVFLYGENLFKGVAWLANPYLKKYPVAVMCRRRWPPQVNRGPNVSRLTNGLVICVFCLALRTLGRSRKLAFSVDDGRRGTQRVAHRRI
jgi:hypothetical protein